MISKNILNSKILNNIEQVELISRKLLSGEMSGDFKTLFKGSGFEFDQLREYQQGDDIRFIDWPSSARSNKILIKQYLEDKNRIVIIAVDFSNSTNFGSENQNKHDAMRKIAGIIAFAALQSKDSVGLMIYTDEIEVFIQPSNSRSHVINLVNKLFNYKAMHKKTNFNNSLKELGKYLNKRALICVVSDFMCNIDHKFLSVLSNIHDLVFLRCLDKLEEKFPNVGFLNVQDLETDEIRYINTENIENLSHSFFYKQNILFRNLGIDVAQIYTDQSLIVEMGKFFFNRSISRI